RVPHERSWATDHSIRFSLGAFLCLSASGESESEGCPLFTDRDGLRLAFSSPVCSSWAAPALQLEQQGGACETTHAPIAALGDGLRGKRPELQSALRRAASSLSMRSASASSSSPI